MNKRFITVKGDLRFFDKDGNPIDLADYKTKPAVKPKKSTTKPTRPKAGEPLRPAHEDD